MAASFGLTGVALGVFRFRVTFLAGVFIFVATLPCTLAFEVALLDERVEAFSFALLRAFPEAVEVEFFRGEILDAGALLDLPGFPFVAAVSEAFFAACHQAALGGLPESLQRSVQADRVLVKTYCARC